MGNLLAQIMNNRSIGVWSLLFSLTLGFAVTSNAQKTKPKPLVLSVQMVKGTLIYKLDGKKVEDTKRNSLLTNLGAIVRERGNAIPVFVIIDVRAPFSEVGKLDTALAKADLLHERKLFVANFQGGIMNEIHWDETGIPIPFS
jgi:hypothetical protein